MASHGSLRNRRTAYNPMQVRIGSGVTGRAGLEIARTERIRRAIEETIASSQVPGIILVVARGDGPVEYLVTGTDAAGNPLSQDSLFPVASITKLAMALAVLRLCDNRTIALDESLNQYLPEASAAQPGITVRGLLCHTAGFPYEIQESAEPADWPALARACLGTRPTSPAGSRVEYSNVGYGLLGVLAERVTGWTIREALQKLVLQPLGVEGYLGDVPPRLPVLLSGIRGPRRGTDLEPYNGGRWRRLGLPWGGLITTAEGALALVRAFAGVPDNFLHPATRLEAIRNQVGDLSCNLFGLIPWQSCLWGLGPELRDAKKPHWAPAEADPGSFGHAGQSGCVAWCDPSRDVAWAILGTRTADSGWLLRRCPAIGAAILALE